MSSRRAFPLSALMLLAGCASAGSGARYDLSGSGGGGDGGGGAHDLGGAKDLRLADLAGVTDQAMASDGAAPGDQGMADDLAVPQDLASAKQDLAGPKQDLAAPADLAKPSDLVMPADLVTPADLAKPSDLVMVNMCVPQTQPCDVICQNCPQGQKCGANAGKPVCEPTGNVPDGQPCGANNVDDCAPGDVCIFESQMIPLNLCMGFCRVDGDCKNGGKCAWTLQGGNLKICSEPITNCDPVKNQGCQMGGCYVVTPNGLTGCHRTSTGAQFDACDTDYDCKGGYSCGGFGCQKVCRVNGDCPLFLTCYAVNGWGGLGVCDI
jgi:hypothetical protein